VRVRAGSEDVAVGAEVELQEELAHGTSWTANADIRGRVAFSDLPPGTFTVYARRGEDRPVRKTVELTAGRTQRVELRLR
ncbi:MAG: carboxypeptidase regulatory-like domain-containing protein, partial [Phycisphaerales bacterium]|nr:carboxypeptidase regulatory-like domain-containing protein [Phycisphaerales bacterium]